MLRKHFIFFLLTFAYSIVLAHNLVPHHHHDEHQTISCHQIEECSDETEHHPLSHAFSFFPHEATDQEVFINHGNSNHFLKASAVNLFLPSTNIDFKLFNHSVAIRYGASIFFISKEFFLLSRSLRAPPSILV